MLLTRPNDLPRQLTLTVYERRSSRRRRRRRRR